MAQKSWHLDRRTFLLGAGVSLALPYLECMGATPSSRLETAPRRFCALYFPFGVSVPKPDSEHAHWTWFPEGEGRDYKFNDSLKPLEKHRESLTVFGGLSHPKGRQMGGHDTGDTFLTGALMNNTTSVRNTVSVDQVAAQFVGDQTRFPSMVLSTDGGVGEPNRSTTLSYNDRGNPIPALNQPQQIFDRLFGVGDADLLARRRRLTSASSMLDSVLEDSHALRTRLGSLDREKFDEYLASVRQTEQRVQLAQRWLEIPQPELTDEERKLLHLEADDEAPKLYMRTMYDLIYLAFKTDSTRVATYQIASMADVTSIAGKFPQLEGFKDTLHTLAHDWNKPGGAEKLGEWDRFMTEQLVYFLDRLASAQDERGTLLDSSLVLYGSSNSQTHNNTNYPLVLAGGGKLGIQHGQYRKFDAEVPMSNLFVTMLNCLGVPEQSFADSSGSMSELLEG